MISTNALGFELDGKVFSLYFSGIDIIFIPKFPRISFVQSTASYKNIMGLLQEKSKT